MTEEEKKVRRPKRGERLRLEVHGLAFGGMGVARTDGGLVVFVRGAVPGDVVDAVVTKRKRDYLEARVEEHVTLSEDRVQPECEHFGSIFGGLCGGCKWQNYPYAKQLEWKEQQVRDHLVRIAGIADPPLEPIIGMETPWEYRNKMEYTFSSFSDGRLKLGLHQAGSFDRIIDVEGCRLQDKRSNELRNAAREFCRARGFSAHVIRRHEGLMRNFVIRGAGDDLMACIVTYTDEFGACADEFADEMTAAFPELKSLFWYINGGMAGVALGGEKRLLAGDDHITEELLGLKLKVSPESFMQTNPVQCAKLYTQLLEYAELDGAGRVMDLYTGMAPIAMLLSRRAGSVVGIESNESAVADGRVNLGINNIDNVELVCGEVEKVLEELCRSTAPDVVSVDPPRAGLHKNALRALIDARPKQVLYISCNPSTLARDAGELIAAGYEMTRARPVDMFPHTAHIECVSRFDLRK